ncbi:hypothetical protein [Paludibacterium denitrificans]|uniref:Uncharacterized protein n=1 Tax=Paludibacterium denitrificans TaxID=2675226 RepID=A0A844GCX7_9NEIS|nr:hypothetical protein [Paludibacterium denitrificans]MTD32445.1 hypothetical protein [Paludibacterium denitrificans]
MTEDKQMTAKRLRRVCKLVGIENAVPDDDMVLMDCICTVLGMIASAIEGKTQASSQPAGEAVAEIDNRGHLKILNHSALDYGVKLYTTPPAQVPSEAFELLRIFQSWLGPNRASCGDETNGYTVLWDRIDAVLTDPPAQVPDVDWLANVIMEADKGHAAMPPRYLAQTIIAAMKSAAPQPKGNHRD